MLICSAMSMRLMLNMSTAVKARKKYFLHKSSESCKDLLTTQSTDLLPCACIHGAESCGRWQITTCDTHTVTSLFLNEYAKNLRYKNTSKQQLAHRSRLADKKSSGDSVPYHFKHEISSQEYITTYRRSKNTNGPEEVIETKPNIMCATQEVLLMNEASDNRYTVQNALPTSLQKPPMIAYPSTNGVYLEPFYPALYGQTNTLSKEDTEANGIVCQPAEEAEERDAHWVPDNAVYRFRQPSRQSYNSVCSYNNNDIFLLRGSPKKSLTCSYTMILKKKKSTSKASVVARRHVPAITNLRTLSGRPIALVKFNKDKDNQSPIHPQTNSLSDNDRDHTHSGANMDSSSSETQSSRSSKDQVGGKLLLGKLRSPFQSQCNIEPPQPLIVHSKEFQIQTTADLQVKHYSEEKVSLKKPKLRPFKQDSVPSIPNKETQLPGLEVRPSSSLLDTLPQVADKEPVKRKKEKRKQNDKNSDDVILTSPVVANQSLQAKSQSPQSEEVCPLTVLHTLSSNLKPGPQNSSHFRAMINSKALEMSKNSISFPVPRQPSDHKDILDKYEDYLNEVPYRHKIISLRKKSKGATVVPMTTESDKVVEKQGQCALRSQQRRQRQQQKTLSGQSKASTKKADEDIGRVCAKIPAPGMKACVKGKAKTLVDFLPNQENKLSQVLYAE